MDISNAEKKKKKISNGLVLNSYIASRNYRIFLKGYDQEEFAKTESELKAISDYFKDEEELSKIKNNKFKIVKESIILT